MLAQQRCGSCFAPDGQRPALEGEWVRAVTRGCTRSQDTECHRRACPVAASPGASCGPSAGPRAEPSCPSSRLTPAPRTWVQQHQTQVAAPQQEAEQQMHPVGHTVPGASVQNDRVAPRRKPGMVTCSLARRDSWRRVQAGYTCLGAVAPGEWASVSAQMGRACPAAGEAHPVGPVRRRRAVALVRLVDL